MSILKIKHYFKINNLTQVARKLNLGKIFISGLIIGLSWWGFREFQAKKTTTLIIQKLQSDTTGLQLALTKLNEEKASIAAELESLQQEDPRKTTLELKQKIAEVEKAFVEVGKVIEEISDARYQGINVVTQEKDLAQAVDLLSQLNYTDATAKLATVRQKISELVTAKQVQITAPQSQVPPAAGSYSRQTVGTDRSSFTVSLIAESAGSVRMVTDTGNDDTCSDNCAVLPLASYVARNGGFAGINGTYFCPPDYPSCAGKINSFNTLVFNSRLKKYMNPDQNVYSTVPMVVQNADRSMRFMGQSLEWGRDTGIVGGIANHPLLVSGGKAVNNEGGNKGPRGFIGVKNNTLYIGVVHGANLGDAALVLQTLGLDTAMNLDGGGSSALFYNGKYIVGPGRNLPNAIILVR